MTRPVLLFVAPLLAASCQTDQNAPPEQITGTWQLHQVEIAGGEVEAQAAILSSYPGCAWGRMTWSFEAETATAEPAAVATDAPATPPDGSRVKGWLEATTDVLCPVAGDTTAHEYYGCTVSARVPAEWDVAGGKWIVANGTQVRSRTMPLDTAALQGPTACEAKIDPGEYPVARVRSQKWKWEMRTPEGTVVRLRATDTDRPDFVTALLDKKAAARLEAAAVEAPPVVPAVPVPGGN